jgi:hypothetical protein
VIWLEAVTPVVVVGQVVEVGQVVVEAVVVGQVEVVQSKRRGAGGKSSVSAEKGEKKAQKVVGGARDCGESSNASGEGTLLVLGASQTVLECRLFSRSSF